MLLPFRSRSWQSQGDLTIRDASALFFPYLWLRSRVLDDSACLLTLSALSSFPTHRCTNHSLIAIMSGVKENFVIPFTGALQASLAVLLTIFYGVIAAQFDLLNEKSAKDISKACVRLFLPALLIVNVGQQLSLESVSDSFAGQRRT